MLKELIGYLNNQTQNGNSAETNSDNGSGSDFDTPSLEQEFDNQRVNYTSDDKEDGLFQELVRELQKEVDKKNDMLAKQGMENLQLQGSVSELTKQKDTLMDEIIRLQKRNDALLRQLREKKI